MLKNIYRNIRNYLVKLTFKMRGKSIRFLKNTTINSTCVFEGYNSIGENTRLSNSYIGKGTYICEDVYFSSVKIGRFCSLGSRVYNLKGSHPTSTFVSTHPAFFSRGKAAGFTFSDINKFKELQFLDDGYLVEIGNDVWIGDNVSIKDGVKIGDGAVIGANSLVTSDIEPYSINVGTPTHVVRFRFSKDDIDFLLNFKWWNMDFAWIKENYELFDDIEKFKATFK